MLFLEVIVNCSKKEPDEHLTASFWQRMQLKARHGGTRVLTITTAPEHEAAAERLLARELSPGRAARIYGVSGTQKFALPRREVPLGRVFGAVEAARRAFPVLGWGVADATLEDVFVRVAKEARAFDVLS